MQLKILEYMQNMYRRLELHKKLYLNVNHLDIKGDAGYLVCGPVLDHILLRG